MYKLILASNSPRRKELLGGLEWDFEVRLIGGIDESYPPHMRGEEIPQHIARKKAAAYLPTLAEDELLITADTIVCLDGEVLGKPHSEEEAYAMLQSLSGRTHEVITGVCLTSTERQTCFASVTNVRFATLSEEEIRHYINHYHPMDKAGSYGIQEWIGYVGVEHIEGSYFNVMGLPIQRLYQEIKGFNPQNEL